MSDDSNLKLLALNKYFFTIKCKDSRRYILLRVYESFFLRLMSLSSMVETLTHYVNNGDLKENPP